MKCNLQEIRRNKHMTRQNLANIVGCSESTISNIEKERNEPKIEIIIKIIKALEINFEDLYNIN